MNKSWKRVLIFGPFLAGSLAVAANIGSITGAIFGEDVRTLTSEWFDKDEPIGHVLLAEATVPPKQPGAGSRRGPSCSLMTISYCDLRSEFEYNLEMGGYANLDMSRAGKLEADDILRVSSGFVDVLTIEEVNQRYAVLRDSRRRRNFSPSGKRYLGDCLILLSDPKYHVSQTAYTSDPIYSSFWAVVADEPCPQ